MKYKQVREMGADDGAEAVSEAISDLRAGLRADRPLSEEEARAEVASWPVRGWDEAAANAGVAAVRGVPKGMEGAYYAAYEMAANAAHEALS